jgi:integrase
MWVYSAGKEQPVNTGLYTTVKQWDAKRQRVRLSHPNHTKINDALDARIKEAESAYAQMHSISTQPTAKAITQKAFAAIDFYEHARAVCAGMTGDTQLRSQRSFGSMLLLLEKFRPTLNMDEITHELVADFIAFLKTQPGRDSKYLANTTIAKRVSQFSEAYKSHPMAHRPSPFEDAKIGTLRPKEITPLSAEQIEALWGYTPASEAEDFARDLFLFSFYAGGMRPSDVLLLRWPAVRENEIVYVEHKKMHLANQKAIMIPIHARLAHLLSKRDRNTLTVFGKVDKTGMREAAKQAEAHLTTANRNLKLIAIKLKIPEWLALKVARRTFADIANKMSGRNVYAVQQAMGHSKIATTEIYLGKDTTAAQELFKQVYATPAPTPIPAVPSGLVITRYNPE